MDLTLTPADAQLFDVEPDFDLAVDMDLVLGGTSLVTTTLVPLPDADEEDAGTSYARCSDGYGTLSHLFFSDDDHELARAKAICRPCGLKATCLAGAIEREEPYGIWGGMLVLDGVAVEVKRKRGRPPKHPKPVLVVDEVPIPDHLVA